MKISDSLLTAHFNVQPEQIEYTVRDSKTRMYFKVKLSGHFDSAEIIIEFDDWNAQAYLITRGNGCNTSTDEVKLLIAKTYMKDDKSPIALVLEIKEQLRRLSEIFSGLFLETDDAPGAVAERRKPDAPEDFQELDFN